MRYKGQGLTMPLPIDMTKLENQGLDWCVQPPKTLTHLIFEELLTSSYLADAHVYTSSLLSGRLASAFDAEHRKQFHFSFDEDHELVNLRAIVESNPAQVRPNSFTGPAQTIGMEGNDHFTS